MNTRLVLSVSKTSFHLTKYGHLFFFRSFFPFFLVFFSVLLGVASCSNSLDCAASQHWLRKYLVLFLGGEWFFFVFLLGLRSNCCRFALSCCGIALSRGAFCFCFALTCCGIALSRVAFCRKLLGDSNFEAPVLRQISGIAISRVSFCLKLLGECNFESPVLRQQLLGELEFAGFAACQTTGEFQLVGYCAVSS